MLTGGHLLSSESFYFCACLRFIPSASTGSHLVVGCSSLANALPPFQTGGCFATVVALVQIASNGCFAAVVVCSDGCFATFFRSSTFVSWSSLFLLAGSVVGSGLKSGSYPVSSPFCFAVVRVVVVFSCLCVHFFSVSLFLVFCVLVLVKLCLAASNLCL